MCTVIITSFSLIWTFFSIVAAFGMVSVLMQAKWLIGYERKIVVANYTLGLDEGQGQDAADGSDLYFTPSLGIYNRCTKVYEYQSYSDNCGSYIDKTGLPSSAWTASLVCICLGIALVCIVVVTSILTMCLRRVSGKSLFLISGVVQAVAGLLLVIGLLCYPAGWGSDRVREVCGQDAASYRLGDCQLGWAFFGAIGATLLILLCSLLAVGAHRTVASNAVEKEVVDGKTFICLCCT